ncbi:MAG TPA: hypothetical protein VFO19_18895 [Vicinamibacterales bacterium]|nr:hypothetical protein [Vicinamibacterales bacterium]
MLTAVVEGQTTAPVEVEYGVTNHIAVIAVDTADNESTPGTAIVIS